MVTIGFGTISVGSYSQTASFPFVQLRILNSEKEIANKNAAFVVNVRQVKIYSTDGRLVKVVDYKDNNNKAFIGDLSQGQYLIELNTENGVFIKKFFRL